MSRSSILITGAASGIGRATALKLAAKTVSLTLVDKNLYGIYEVAGLCRASGAVVLEIQADVASGQDVAYAVEYAYKTIGLLTGVVAAAGVAQKGDVLTLSDTDWHTVLSVNLTGPFLLARHSVPLLLKNSESAFVAVGSDASLRGSRGYAAYCASKHALLGLIRCMALDHGAQGLRSNIVCPSFVDTPMADDLLKDTPEIRALHEKRVPLGRFAKSDEIAEAIAHLLSPQASYVNGMVYSIDGGSTAGAFV